jgi:16S rRNA G966 N2-methylase RsmD
LDVVRVVTAELYLVPLAFAALLMAAAHVVLVAANVTTFECARQRHLDYLKTLNGDHVLSDPPFSRGIAQNLVLAFRASFDGQEPWTPIMWEVPADCTSKADSDSTDWWENLWRNKYWSCC